MTADTVNRMQRQAWEARIAALQARVAELEAAREWRDIATAPKDGTEVLLVDSWRQRHIDAFEDGSWSRTDYTHWMPLPPQPPTEDE